MSFRFFRRLSLLPGLTLNFSKSGPSLSIGRRGLRHTIGPRGSTSTVGLPGTGLSYSRRRPRRSGQGRAGPTPADSDPVERRPSASRPDDRPSDDRPSAAPSAGRAPGPRAEPLPHAASAPDRQAPPDPPPDPPSAPARPAAAEGAEDRRGSVALPLLRALVAYEQGKLDDACGVLSRLPDVPDAAWLKGMIRLQQKDFAAALAPLRLAHDNADALDRGFSAGGVIAEVTQPLTPEITVTLTPCAVGTALALAEAHQGLGDPVTAFGWLVRHLGQGGPDAILAISIAEIALEAIELGRPVALPARILDILEQDAEDATIAASLHLYRARFLVESMEYRAALVAYEQAAGAAEDRSALRHTALYERALTHDALGDWPTCRRILSGIHAVDPDFADIADRLTGRSAPDGAR